MECITSLKLFKTSGTVLQCEHYHLHPCSGTDVGVSFCSQNHSLPGRRRCRGHRPYFLTAPPLVCLGGSAPAPSACLWGGSWLVGKPPGGSNRDHSLTQGWTRHLSGEQKVFVTTAKSHFLIFRVFFHLYSSEKTPHI